MNLLLFFLCWCCFSYSLHALLISRVRRISIALVNGNRHGLLARPNVRALCSTTSGALDLPANEGHHDDVLRIPPAVLKRFGIWCLFASAGYAVRHFYPVIISTFFLSYLGSGITDFLNSLTERTKKVDRKVFVAIYLVSVSTAVLYGMISLQSSFIEKFSLDPMAGISALQKVKDIASFSKSDDFMVSIEAVISLLGISNPNTIQSIMHYIVDNGGAVRSILPAGFNHLEKAFNFAVHSYAEKSFILLKKLISASSAFVYQFILSFIFSSMIVWDRKYISNAVQSLKHSRLGFLYNEVSPKLSAFALVLGQTLEVQAIGSSINTVLTTLVLLSLRIPGLSFFAMLTFFSSFIPILGILISTIPPLVVALNEFGLSCGVQLIAMICLVHLFEGYVIYPQIYAAKMKLHPLLVMGSLAAFEHYFGVTGLLLAVPITHFVINEIIFGKNKSNDKLVSDSNSETA